MSTLPPTDDTSWKYARVAMAWHGWGSPVGVGILAVCIGAAALLLRYALLGA